MGSRSRLPWSIQIVRRPIGGAPVGCGRFRFHAAPGAPGQACRCEDGRYIVGGERIGLAAAPARRLASEALQHAADAGGPA